MTRTHDTPPWWPDDNHSLFGWTAVRDNGAAASWLVNPSVPGFIIRHTLGEPRRLVIGDRRSPERIVLLEPDEPWVDVEDVSGLFIRIENRIKRWRQS